MGVSTYTAYLGLDAEMVVESVGIRIPLRSIYERVELPESEAPEVEPENL